MLRAMQQAGDRQKTLAEHGAQPSDDRLTMQVVDIGRFREVEGTDGQVHYFPQTSELEELRRTAGLSTNFLAITGRLLR